MGDKYEVEIDSQLELSKIDAQIEKLNNTKITLDVEVKKDSATQLQNNINKSLKGIKVDSSKISKEIANAFNIKDKGIIGNIQSKLQSVFNNLANTWNGKSLDIGQVSGFYEGLSEISDMVTKNAYVIENRMGVYDEFYNYFRNKKIYISDELKSALGDDLFKELQQNNIGKIVRDASKGVSIDSIWGEMTSMFPEHFSTNTLAEADQIVKAFEVLKLARADIDKVIDFSNMTPEQQFETAEAAVNQIYQSASQMMERLQTDLTNITAQDKSTFDLEVSVNTEKIKADIIGAVKSASLGDAPIDVLLNVNEQEIVSSIQSAIAMLGANGTSLQVDVDVNKQGIQSELTKVLDGLDLPVNFNINAEELKADIQKALNALGEVQLDLHINPIQSDSIVDNDNVVLAENMATALDNVNTQGKAGKTIFQRFGNAVKDIFSGNSLEMFASTGGIMLLTQQLRKAWEEAMTLDSSFTDLIKVQDELTRSDYPAYLDECNKKAQDLATTQKSLIEGTTEFSKSGYTLEESERLTEKSIVLANVGDMSASESAKTIISGVQSYETVDGYDDAVNKAQALIDKYNEIGNTASITTAEIAKGVQTVGSVFSDANTSVDEFIALLAAGNRQYQNADALALSLRTAALRIRGCTTELELMGESTDGVYTSASKLQEKIAGLTNVNGSGGVQILEADGETFRSIYDIFLDISNVYQQMSDTDQSALLDLIAGKHRASAISATFKNMSEAQEIYQNSINATGSAQREYDKYLESSEAALNRFKSSMTETYQNVLTGETVTGILNCGNAALQFANSLGLIETSLKGIVVVGAVKAVTTLSTVLKSTALQASNFGTALQTVKDMASMTKGTSEYANALNVLKNVTGNLSDARLKQILSNTALSKSEQIILLQTRGLSKVQAEAKLAQLGLTQSTNAQSAANVTATASTFSFSSAVKGLAVSFKTLFLNNPIAWIMTAVGAIYVATKAYDHFTVSLEEAQEATSKAVQTYNDISSEVENLKTNLSNLQSQIDGLDPLTDKEDIANLQAESEELERQLAILEEKRRVAGLEADKAAQESLGKTIESKYEGSETFDLGTLKNKFVGDKVTEQEELQNAMDAYDEYAEYKAQKEAELAEMAKSGDYTQEEWDAAEQAIADYDQKMQDARLHANELATSLNEQKQGLNGNTAESRKLINETDTQIDKYTKWTEKINEATGALDKNTQAKNNNNQPQSVASTRSEMISDLNDMSEGFESLDKLYASVKDSDPFDFKLLDDKNFKETFSGLGDAYEDFVEQITSTPDDIEACQGAFDDLLTEWVHSTGILSNVTEENAKLTESMLTQMGVANAEEVVMKQLAAQKAYAAETSQDLANATAEDIMNFYNESTAADETKNQIYAYYLEKQLAAGLALDTSADVNALYNLVSALGGATSALKIYYGMLNGGAGLNAADVSGMSGSDGKYAKQMAQNQAKAEIEKIQANMKANTNVKFSGGTKSKGTSGSGGGSGSKSTSKLFDWIERRIQKFQTKFDRWIKEAETAVTSGFVTKYYNRAATAEKNLMNTQGSAYTYYMKKANKVGLSNKYEKKVKNGKISIENVKSEKTQTKIDNYQSYYDKAQQALDAFRESAEKFYNIPLEKSAKKIELLSEAIELLDAKLENADGYTTQNNILETQINKQKQILDASNSAETETGKKLSSAGKTLKKSANLKGLSKDNKKTVKDAIKASEEIDISLFKEGSKGYQAAVKYNEALKANKKAIYEADLAQEEYTSTLHENRMQQLENIKAEYDAKDAILDASTSRLQAMNDLKESRGEYLSASDYEGLLGNASANILNQEEELKEYVERFNQNRSQMSAEDIADATAYIDEMKAGIEEAKQEQQKLNNAVANLPYEKYERQLELLDAIAEKRKSEVDLAEAQGKDLLESDYIDQINNNLTEIKLLEAERNQAYNDYMNAMRNGGVYGGKSAEEWQKEYLGLDAEINGVKADNEALKDSLRDDVYWRDFERAHKACEDLQSVLEGMDGLIDEAMMFDDDGNFTELGVSHIANLVKQYENARDEVQNYTDDIENLDKLYKEGQYTEQEYKEKLVELQGGLFDSADAMKSYINSVKELYKQQEQAELDNLFEIIDARNEALQKKKEYYDYDKNLKNQTKELQILEAERAALEGINTAEAKAKKAQLDAEIAEQKEALDETVEQHLMDISSEALDSLKETMQDAFDDRWANMDSNMQAMVGLMQTANELSTQNAASIKNAMYDLLRFYGIEPSDTGLTSVTGYAGGTKKVPRDMIAMINESGAEMIVTKYGLLTPLSQGDGVIPADMTENLMNAAKYGVVQPQIVVPNVQVPNNIENRSENVYIDKYTMFNVEGNTSAITMDDIKKMEDKYFEKSYQYTSKKMFDGYLKTGGKRRV